MPRDLERWLKESPRNLTLTQFYRLSEEERQLLFKAYKEQRTKEAEKVGRLERRRREKLDKYLQKLRTKKAAKK